MLHAETRVGEKETTLLLGFPGDPHITKERSRRLATLVKLLNDAPDESSEAGRKREAAEGEAPRGASDDDTETVSDEETSPLHEEEPQEVVAVAGTPQELLDKCSLTDTRTSSGFEVYVSDNTKIRQFRVSQQKQRTVGSFFHL